jgi:hypothetical protein
MNIPRAETPRSHRCYPQPCPNRQANFVVSMDSLAAHDDMRDCLNREDHRQ